MVIKKSLAFYIIGLIVFLILLTSVSFYYVDVSNQKNFIDIYGYAKDKDIRFVVQSLFNEEVENLSSLSRSLKDSEDLLIGIALSSPSDENIDHIKQVMQRLDKELDMDIFQVTDVEGVVINDTHNPGARGKPSEYMEMPDFKNGKDILIFGESAGGGSILAGVPAMWGQEFIGAIIIGTIINDNFVARMAKAADVQLTFGTAKGVLASSLDSDRRGHLDFQSITKSLDQKKNIRKYIADTNKVITYAPFNMADTLLALVVEFDTDEFVLLTEGSKKAYYRIFLTVVLVAILTGAGLTLFMISPLKKLQMKAETTVKDISGRDISQSRADEVRSLVRSFDVMVETVNTHLSERAKAEKELQEAHDELEKKVTERTAELSTSNKLLSQAVDEARAADDAKGKFVAKVSHEIRTPMHGIIGLTDLLLNTPLKADQEEYLSMLRRSADSLLTVINDILDFSKIEAEKLFLEPANFSLRSMLNDAVTPLSVKAENKGVSLVVDVKQNVPDLIVGDPVRLGQVLINLAGNAVKFTDKGSITVTVEKDREYGDEVWLHFYVSDTGRGMSEDQTEVIFDAFTQADSGTGGTGLGLSISSSIVKMMRGELHVRSSLGEGSTFHFCVPFNLPPVEAEKAVANPAPEMPSVAARGKGLNILLVEDNIVNLTLAMGILEKGGHSVKIAYSGVDAVEAMIKQSFDLVLMDVRMPVMNGLEATKIIRKREQELGIHTPIIAMTASAMKADRDACIHAGMDDFVAKPVSAAELLDRVSKFGG
jgi:signal transduction histidine kinase